MRRSLLALLLVSSATALPARAASPPDACVLLPAADVEAELGDGYRPLPPMPASDYSACIYQKARGELAGILVFRAPGGAARDLAERGQRSRSAVPVPELGEGAFLAVSGDKMGLNFGKGEWQATLEVYRAGKPDVETATRLARRVLALMP